MTEKEFIDLKELINANTSLIKEFKLFAINHLHAAFALSKTVDNKIEMVKSNVKQSFKIKEEVSTAVILKAASTITKNKK